jgi:hypothetical protein
MSVSTRLPAGPAVIASSALPFFGFPLWAVAVALFGLLLVAFALRRKLRTEDAESS